MDIMAKTIKKIPMVMSKCVRCGETKLKSKYDVDANRREGRESYCSKRCLWNRNSTSHFNRRAG